MFKLRHKLPLRKFKTKFSSPELDRIANISALEVRVRNLERKTRLPVNKQFNALSNLMNNLYMHTNLPYFNPITLVSFIIENIQSQLNETVAF